MELYRPDLSGQDREEFLPAVFWRDDQADEQVSYWTKYTEEELSAMAEEYRRETEAKLIEKGVQIIENNVTILDNDSACLFRLEMITGEPAGSPAPIETGMEQEQPSEGES